jgi:hypothetical protein
MKPVLLLTYALCSLVACSSNAQSCKSETAKILKTIYSYQFEETEKLLAREHCSDLETEFLKMYLSRWKNIPIAFSSQKKQYLNALLVLKEKASSASENNFIRMFTQLFLSEQYFTDDKKMSAASELYEAYPLFVNSFNDSVTNIQSTFIQGLYLYYTDHFADQSKSFWIVSGALKQGNKAEGLAKIHQAAFADSLVGIEAAIYEAHILLHIEERYSEALKICEQLASMYPANLKFIEMYAECLLMHGEHDACQRYVKLLLDDKNTFYHCAGFLYKGIIEEEKLADYIAAKKSYEMSIKAGNQYAKLLNYYISKAKKRKDLIDSQ